MKNRRAFAIALAAVGVFGGAARAFINPGFTPRDLLENSQAVLVLEFKSLDANTGLAVAAVTKVLAYRDANLRPRDPNSAPKELKINFLATDEDHRAQGKMIMNMIAAGERQAIFFYGNYHDSEGCPLDVEEAGKRTRPFSFLQFTNKWMILSEDKSPSGPIWGMDKVWEHLNSTWNGSTDMLIRCLEYLQSDPKADVPCNEEVDWDIKGICRFGRVTVKVFAALPVDVTGTGKADLFLAAEAGDRLYRWDGKGMGDITAKTGLTTKSQVAVWADFDGDGKLDLASWDGKTLSVSHQKADGTLAAPKDAGVGAALKDCITLATLDVGKGAKAGLVAGTKTWPVLLTPKEGGTFEAKALGTGEFPAKEIKDCGACLVADLDGDAVVDILQLSPGGALVHKGTGPGQFAPPIRAPLGAGSEKFAACLGDFDGDGLQDVLIAGDARSRLFQNLGGMKFIDMLDYSGELEYIPKPGGNCVWSGDFTKDGRQGILIGYGTPMAPQLFFNRGFRCFGLCREHLDLVDQRATLEGVDPTLVPEAQDGQQAVCLGDFNGDGALDMVLVLTGTADMPKEGQETGKPIAARATLYWDANDRVATDRKDGSTGVVLGKAEKAAAAEDTGVPIRVAGGNLVHFPILVSKEWNLPARAAVVRLPAGGPSPGPVNVLAYSGKRLLGAWSVRAGDGGAIIGSREPCTMTLRWSWPDGRAGEKKVQVKDGPVPVLLDGN